MHHSQYTEHHTLVTCSQIIHELFTFFSLLFQVIRNHCGKVIVGILPSLPVCDIRLHTKQTFFHFLHCFISRNRNHINAQHQISIHVGQFCYHIVFNVRSILPKKEYPSVTLSHAEIIFFKFKSIRADIIFEAVPFSHTLLNIKMETRFFSCTVKIMQNP